MADIKYIQNNIRESVRNILAGTEIDGETTEFIIRLAHDRNRNYGAGAQTGSSYTNDMLMKQTVADISLEEKVRQLVTFHPVTSEARQIKHDVLRDAAYNFILAIVRHTERGADRAAAIRHARNALMTANASLALNGQTYDL